MSINLNFDGGTSFPVNGGSAFRIRRPLITTNGFVSDVDPTVKGILDELNTLLGKSIFSPPDSTIKRHAQPEADQHKGGGDVESILKHPLTPKRISETGEDWEDKTLGYILSRDNTDAKNHLTLSEYIDRVPALSELKYAFQGDLSANWSTLDYNTQTVIDGYPAIVDYLVTYAFLVMRVQDVDVIGIRNFVLGNRAGVKNIVNYAVVSAARSVVTDEHLDVPDYNRPGELVARLTGAGLSLSSTSFRKSVLALIHDYTFNINEMTLIKHVETKIGSIPSGIKPLLVKYIKSSSIPITATNAEYFMPLFISKINGAADISDSGQTAITEDSDSDFAVDYLQDDSSQIQISQSAIRCAAQLYYDMVLGDELDTFSVVNFFTHKYLVRGSITIEDSQLRDDLQTYVFSNKFTDLRTKQLVDRTRPAERQMFYRQVFNWGNAHITEDIVPNPEFDKLWKVLMLESAKYLERAQLSPNPDSFVSRQNVMQAVEDLQYNLSTHCTGIANVISPLIYAELNFVIQRIFMHPEILRQIVPAGGTWWRVVETLYVAMKNVRPKSTVYYNKAKLGHAIIKAVADYNPPSFEDDKNFSSFISDVDAYITTQSILQETLTDELTRESESAKPAVGSGPATDTRSMPPPAPTAVHAGADEWDF